MKKIKEMFKKIIDEIILRNREFLENHYDKIGMGAIAVFITTSLSSPFINAPKTMFSILGIEILLIVAITQFRDYIDKILD